MLTQIVGQIDHRSITSYHTVYAFRGCLIFKGRYNDASWENDVLPFPYEYHTLKLHTKCAVPILSEPLQLQMRSRILNRLLLGETTVLRHLLGNLQPRYDTLS